MIWSRERSRISKRAVFPWGIVFSVAFDSPIITSGSRGDHKTERAEDIEPAKSGVLCPLDMLEFWCLLVGDTKVFLGRDSWYLDIHHGGGSFAWSCQTVTIVFKRRVLGGR